MKLNLLITLLSPLLLIPFATSSDLECSMPKACYGMPVNCRPDTDCHLILNFDAQGNLDVHVNDVIDQMAYIAIAVDTQTDTGITEYVICLPRQQQRLRGVAAWNEPVRITEQPMARYVSNPTANNFICSFLATELPPDFRNRDVFSVVEGRYEDNLVIPEGDRIVGVAEPLFAHPIAFSSDSDDVGVLSVDERKATSDLLGKLRRINNGGEKSDLESLLEDKKESNDEEEDLDDMLDSEKKYSTRRRQEQNKKRRQQVTEADDDEEEKPQRRSRPSRYQEDEDEEEEEEEELPKRRRNNKKGGRRAQEDDEEEEEEEDEEEEEEERPRKKKNNGRKGGKRGGSRKEEEENDEDEYEDEKNETNEDYDNGSLFISAPLAIIMSVLVVFMMQR